MNDIIQTTQYECLAFWITKIPRKFGDLICCHRKPYKHKKNELYCTTHLNWKCKLFLMNWKWKYFNSTNFRPVSKFLCGFCLFHIYLPSATSNGRYCTKIFTIVYLKIQLQRNELTWNVEIFIVIVKENFKFSFIVTRALLRTSNPSPKMVSFICFR